MFRLAHLSDIHAGYKATRLVNSQGINLREADGYVTLSRIVKDVILNEVDAVVIAGDVFHTPTPEMRSIIFVQNQFRKLWQSGIPVYALAGNHDTNDIRADIAASRVLDDPWRKIYSHAEPYAVHEIADGIHLHLVSHHMYSDQGETMKHITPVKNEINIFSTHGSCIDPILEEKLHTEQSPREIVIPDELLKDKDWSYTMLGHIHERGWVGSKDKKTDTSNTKIYYNGSIIRRGFSDKHTPLGRGWTLWEIDSSGQFKATPKSIAQRPQYDFEPINAKEISASEITDIIIENLKNTQTDGTKFNTGSAPILRQSIEQITPAKYTAIDWRLISQNSAHALSWGIKTSYLNEQKNDDKNVSMKISDNKDMLKIYDEWSESSKTIENLSKETKKEVNKQAREFVKMGQEEVLDVE